MLNKLHNFVSQKISAKKARILSSSSSNDLEEVAAIIKNGGIVAFPFNGIYGLFGDIDNLKAAKKILKAKNRPSDKNLIVVFQPEKLPEFIDISQISYKKSKIIKLWKEIHALGIIMPASEKVPGNLILKTGSMNTVLPIWTEYKPLRQLLKNFQKLGGRALVGTSANKSGQPTHYRVEGLIPEFERDVDAIITDSFDNLHPSRLKSTTVIDLSNGAPRLHRLGNVEEEELSSLLKKHGLPDLIKQRDIIVVQSRD